MGETAQASKSIIKPAPGLVLCCAGFYVFCLILSRNWTSLCLLTAIGGLGSILAGAGVRKISRVLSRAWIILCLTFLIHFIVNSQFVGSNGIYSMFHLNPDQAQVALKFTLRFALILVAMSALNMIHDMGRYGQAIGKILAMSPFGRSTLAQLELMATLALRMIPFVQRQYRQLELALAARGESTPLRMPRLYKAKRLMYPLMIESLRVADRSALTLQARGFDPTVRRTYFRAPMLRFPSVICGVAFCALSYASLFV